jgi:PhnB protein
MANVRPVPEGYEGIIPHIVVKGGTQAIDFYKKAFGAEEVMRIPSPDGRLLHGEIRIGESYVFLCDDFPENCGGKSRLPQALGGTSKTIHRFVNDVDAVVGRAASAGAKVKQPVADTFWGDRYGVVEDPFGHEWSFATHKRDMTPEQIARAQAEAFAKGPPTSSRVPTR